MSAAVGAAQRYDVAIVGGGPVGASFGALLLGAEPSPRSRVLLVDRDDPVAGNAASAAPAAGAAQRDLRVFALSRSSERILRAAGSWPAIAAGRCAAYQRMHVWPESVAPRSPGALTFDAALLDEPDLGWIVEHAALQSAAAGAFHARGGVTLAGRVESVLFEDQCVRLRGPGLDVEAKLLVGADGARSTVRRLAMLPAESQDYSQLAIVATVHCEHPHEHTAWQRFLGHGTLALLPLAGGECSIVWSLAEADARARLALEPAAFSAALTEASDGVLGTLTLASDRLTFPLRRLQASTYIRERCALIGDAAHVVHPLAGQGLNLGLLDAAALAESLTAAAGEDPGALRVLRGYERWRRHENELMSTALDLFNRFLAFGRDPAGRLAQRTLGWVDAATPLKRLLVERALGLDGDLPAVARARLRR